MAMDLAGFAVSSGSACSSGKVRPSRTLAAMGLGEAAALRFTLTRLHDRIFHDPSKLVTPKDPAVFLRRLDGWRALEAVA